MAVWVVFRSALPSKIILSQECCRMKTTYPNIGGVIRILWTFFILSIYFEEFQRPKFGCFKSVEVSLFVWDDIGPKNIVE